MHFRNILIAVVCAIGAVALGFFFLNRSQEQAPTPEVQVQPDVAEVQQVETTKESVIVFGHSVEGRPLEAYSFGNGSTHLLFIGGIHGGYEWNTVLLAYEFIDYLTEDTSRIPDDLTITIIPALNPDGLFAVTQKEGRFSVDDIPENVDESIGRFNARGVDLNRNFDCKWQPESTWRGKTVSAGNEIFSEPESRALLDFVLDFGIDATVFWHSQSNAVYASECTEGILPGTRTLMETYAHAAGYKAIDTFDAYPVTGDAEGWLASIGIPAITVELATHETIEWEKNLAGFDAIITEYSIAK